MRSYFLFAHTPNLGAMESNVIYGIQRLLAGWELYTDPAKPPYAILQYTPLYYYLCALLGKLFGVSPDDLISVLILNRSLSLLFNFLTVLVAYRLITKALALPRFWALGASLLMFLYLEPAHYGRPDSLESCCFMMAVYAMMRYVGDGEHSGKWGYILGAGCAAVLATLAKQNGVILLMVLSVFGGMYGKNKQQLGITILASGLLGIGGMWWMAGGEWAILAQNIVQGVNNGIDVLYFLDVVVGEGLGKFFLPFLVGGWAAWTWLGKAPTPKHRLLAWLIVGSFAFALLTGLKWGSIPSYFTDCVNMCLIAGAAQLHSLYLRVREKEGYLPFARLLALGLVLTLPLHFTGKEWGRIIAEDRSSWWEEATAVHTFLTQNQYIQPDELLFAHDYLLNLMLFRHATFPQNDIVYCCAWPRKSYDYRDFTSRANEGLISYVIDYKEQPLRPLVDFEFEGFELFKTVDRYAIWRRPRE